MPVRRASTSPQCRERLHGTRGILDWNEEVIVTEAGDDGAADADTRKRRGERLREADRREADRRKIRVRRERQSGAPTDRLEARFRCKCLLDKAPWARR